MSILIKGMDMPKNCTDCPIYNCPIDSMSRTQRADGCPLFYVPPHGRLIEAEPLETGFEAFAYKNGGKSYAAYTAARAWVKNAPTIIPAEEAHNGE